MAALAGAYRPWDHHDAAVLALISCFSTDPDVRDAERWKAMLSLWIETAADDEFWSALRDAEESGAFEPSAAHDDFDELRMDLFKLVAEPIAELARDAASQTNFDRCRRMLEVFRTSGFPLGVASAVEEEVLGPYEDGLGRLVKDIQTQCWNRLKQDRHSAELNRQVCAVAVSRCKEELEPKYAGFMAMAGRESEAGSRATKEYADFLVGLGNSLLWADEWAGAEITLTKALSLLASDDPARERINATLRKFAESAARQRSEAQREARQSRDDTSKAPKQEHETEIRNTADERTSEDGQGINSGVSGFLELCEAMRIECWAHVHRAHGQKDVSFFKAARADYRSQVAPWLEIILSTYRSDANTIARVRNAAAGCLFSISSGFMAANELDDAQALVLEAFRLVSGDKTLQGDIECRLKFICFEKERLTPKPVSNGAPRPQPRTEPRKVGGHKQRTGNKHDHGTSDRKLQRVLRLVVGTVLAILVGVLIFVLFSQNQPASTKAEGKIANSDQTPTRAADNWAALAKKYGLTLSDKEPKDVPLYQAIEAPPSVVQAVPEHRRPLSLPNGANLIAPLGTNGLGQLTISNYSDEDAAVKIKTALRSRTMRFVYVRAMKDVTISGIPPGNYVLQFSTGKDWDRTTRRFRENRRLGQFDHPLFFSEYRTPDNRIHYLDARGTIHTVPNGNVHIRPITAAEFDDDGTADIQQSRSEQ